MWNERNKCSESGGSTPKTRQLTIEVDFVRNEITLAVNQIVLRAQFKNMTIFILFKWLFVLTIEPL